MLYKICNLYVYKFMTFFVWFMYAGDILFMPYDINTMPFYFINGNI